MAITITGSKYNGTITGYNNKRITVSGANFTATDFESQRILGVWSSSGDYKGLSWIRGHISGNTLEMESNFIDKDGVEFNPISSDRFQVSLNFEDVATNGLSISNNLVNQTDNLIIGTNNNSESVCFYDEGKTINVSNDSNTYPYQFRGGLFVMGHLLNYEDRTFFNPVNLYSSDGGANGNQINVSNLSAKVWWLGGTLSFELTPARLPGGSAGSPAEWQKWWGVETNADFVTPSGGANWTSNNTNQQFINCGSLPSSNNAIGFRLSNSDFQGGFCKISGGSVISPFGADALGTYNIGAPTNQRFNVLDMGTNLTKTAFWRKSTANGSQFIEVTNVISTDFRMGTGVNAGSSPYTNGTGTVNFKDSYNNPVQGTKVVIIEDSNNVQASTGQSLNGESIELSVKYADIQGHQLTVNETNWRWGAIEYTKSIVSGSFSVSDVPTIDGLAKNVSHGASLIQPNDNSITETDKTAVDNYTGLENVYKLYDRAKAFLVDNYNGEAQTIVTRSGDSINAGSYNIVIDENATDVFSFDGNTITFKASEFSGSIITTGSVTVLNGLLPTNGNFNTLILSGNYSNALTIDGLTIDNLENNTGVNIELTLVNDSDITNLIETNGTLSIPKILTITDIAGDEIKIIAGDNSNVGFGTETYPYTSAVSHNVPVTGIDQLRVTIDKPEHYARTYIIDITAERNQEYVAILDRSPNVDSSTDISDLVNATTTSIEVDLYGSFDVFRATINQSVPTQTADQWRRYHDYFTETENGLKILWIFGINGNQVYNTNESGIQILMPSLQVIPSGVQTIETQAFIDETRAELIVPAFDYTPRNADNVKVITSTVIPIIDYSLIGGGNGGSSYDDTILIGKVDDIDTKVTALQNYDDTIINSKLDAIPTTDSVADITPVLNAIANLNNITPLEVRNAFNAVDFQDKNTELEIHNWLDSYTNKDNWKGNDADLTNVINNQNVINEGVKKASLLIPHNTDL